MTCFQLTATRAYVLLIPFDIGIIPVISLNGKAGNEHKLPLLEWVKCLVAKMMSIKMWLAT